MLTELFAPLNTADTPTDSKNRMIMALPLGAIQLAVISCITTTLAIIAMILRLWSRYLQNQRLVIHDYFALAGMFLTAGAVSVYLSGKVHN